MRSFRFRLPLVLAIAWACPALAGPPYVTDDPEPTENGQYEIYLFGAGTRRGHDASGETGIDFNYGGGPDLQLTAVLPVAYERTADRTIAEPGNIELGAKYRFLHQEVDGWDVAFFPRLFLPSLSRRVGENHPSFLLPAWLEKDWGRWSTFGGGGCAIHRGAGAKDFCLAGWAVNWQALPDLQLGMELFHQTPGQRGGRAETGLGFGIRYDLGETYHLIGSIAPGLQNPAEIGRVTWYSALLLTF